MRQFIRIGDYVLRKSSIISVYKSLNYFEDEDGLVSKPIVSLEYGDKSINVLLKNEDEFEEIIKELMEI